MNRRGRHAAVNSVGEVLYASRRGSHRHIRLHGMGFRYRQFNVAELKGNNNTKAGNGGMLQTWYNIWGIHNGVWVIGRMWELGHYTDKNQESGQVNNNTE